METPTNIDALTGLYNERYAMAELRRFFDEVGPFWDTGSGSVGVIFADIFRLKLPHDKYGHAPIDVAIQDVGHVVQSLARENDLACRYAGDEFLLIMPQITEEETRRKAEQLRQAAEQLHIRVNGQPQEPITLSVGSAHYPSIYREEWNSKLHGAELLMKVVDADLMRDRERNAQKQAG